MDGVHHIQGGQVVVLELVGVQPDPHAVGPGAEHLDLAHPGQTAQGVLQVDDGVVGEIGGIIAVIVGVDADHLQDVGGDLAHGDALGLHRLGKLGGGAVHHVLHQGQRRIEIGAHREGHGEGVISGTGTGGGHVDGAFHAVDRLFDGDSHRVGDDLGAGPGIHGGHLDGGRHDFGILRHRQKYTDTPAPE